jgi:hypothetical protein
MASKLSQRGMPLSSTQAAQSWREINAKPRQWKSKVASAKPSTKPPAPRTTAPAPSKASPAPSSAPAPDEDGPAESLRRARSTERQSFKNLERLQRDKLATPEDLRKSSSVYFASRSNRQKAEVDHREWQRAEGVTMFFDEAKDIASRPHQAARNMLSIGGKELSVRCYGQSQKAIQATIDAWLDRLTEILRSSI